MQLRGIDMTVVRTTWLEDDSTPITAQALNSLETRSRPATIIVAAANTSDKGKAAADYVCDGTADDVQINAAITALGGLPGTVLLLEGTYHIAASITLYTGQRLTGLGRGTVLARTATGTVAGMLHIGSVQRVMVDNLVLDGSAGGTTTAAIYVTTAQHILIDTVIIREFRAGIMLVDTVYADIRGISVLYGGIGGGITISDSTNIRVTGCTVGLNSGVGINIPAGTNSARDNVIANNTLYQNTGCSIGVGGTYNMVRGNICRKTHAEIIAIPVDLPTEPEYGIIVAGDHNWVTDNDLYNAGTSGGISNTGTNTLLTSANRT
jgi:hypothetical protein